ncbi:MAG: hypothetical protein HYZ37_00310 [Candidatus Solibacter usitatus]|nr:hypothetical protein [Candidatus Solibacter usitatus]
MQNTELNIESREQLRANRKLRIITKDESGAPIDDAPAGVYGFTYSPHTDGTPLFHLQSFQIFEVHKLAKDDWHYLGCLTEEDARALETAAEAIEVKLYPEPFEQAQTMVSIPRARIERTKPASRDNGNFMVSVIRPK